LQAGTGEHSQNLRRFQKTKSNSERDARVSVIDGVEFH